MPILDSYACSCLMQLHEKFIFLAIFRFKRNRKIDFGRPSCRYFSYNRIGRNPILFPLCTLHNGIHGTTLVPVEPGGDDS